MPRNKQEHVSLWHPWKDKPGQRHKLTLWSDYAYESVDKAIEDIGNGQHYAICNDILSGSEVDTALVRDGRTDAYLSRTGNVAALRVKSKRKSGFLIPAQQWGCSTPRRELLGRMEHVFNTLGFEALTPSSLSEKVLRSTLPDRSYISRPSDMLRRSLIMHGKGGRIDKKEISKFYPIVYENDMNKAYLYCSQWVPDPKIAPTRFYNDDSVWQNYPASWMEVEMVCHRGNGIQPIQIKDENGELREPYNGESFDTWLWSGEVSDCLQAGYALRRCCQGWCFPFMSDFMQRWSDILWNAYSNESSDEIRDIYKGMMVGLPGRFLKAPEKYTLVHKDDCTPGMDAQPLPCNWLNGSSPMSDWKMIIEEDIDSAQLTPIGSFIVAECRRKLYRDSKREEERGNTIVRLYIDSFSTTGEGTTICKGKGRGEYKTKVYHRVRIVHNRFMGYNEKGELVLKAPGVDSNPDSVDRRKVIAEMESIAWHNFNDPP